MTERVKAVSYEVIVPAEDEYDFDRHAGQTETRQAHRHQHADRQDRGVRGGDHGRVLGATRTGPVTGTGISHTPQLCPKPPAPTRLNTADEQRIPLP